MAEIFLRACHNNLQFTLAIKNRLWYIHINSFSLLITGINKITNIRSQQYYKFGNRAPMRRAIPHMAGLLHSNRIVYKGCVSYFR